ncbi:MAG: 30S ribosomal protein S17 [Candidatus Binatia bacterium]
MSGERGLRRQWDGVVVSDKMQKTIVVRVDRKVQHRQYKKYVRRRKKFKVHDEKNECKIGDRVRIEESRPLSRDKRWRLSAVLERAKA